MIFTAGNIITLIISLLVVVVLRQRDKTSRSLDILKKYGKNLCQELETLTQQKIETLEQKSLDLDVQQKTTIAAIKRLEEIRDQVLVRTSDMSKIGEQINRYDEVLKELLDMTERAQSSMKALQNEAEFSEHLAKNLTAAESRLKKVEADIPDLQKNFTAANTQALAAVQKNIEASFTDDITEVNHKISIVKERAEALTEDAVKSLESQKDAYTRQLDEMTVLSESNMEKLHKVFDNAFIRAAEQADKLEHEAITKLREKATERIDEYKATVESKCKELSDHIKAEMAETKKLADSTKSACVLDTQTIKTELEALKSDTATRQTELTAIITEADKEIAQQINDFKSRVDVVTATALQDSELKMSELAKTMDKNLSAYKDEVAYRSESIELSLKDINRVEEDLRGVLEQTESKVSGDFMTFVNDQITKHQAFEAELNGKFGTLDSRIMEIDSELSVLKTQAANNVSEKLKLFEDEFAKDLGSRSEEINKTLEDWKENMNHTLNHLAETTSGQTKEAEESLSATLHSELNILQGHYRDQHSLMEKQIAASSESMQQQIKTIEDNIASFDAQYRNELDTARATAESALQNAIDTHTRNVQDYLKTQEKEISAQTQQMAALVQETTQSAESGITEAKETIATWRTRFDQQVSDFKEDISRKFDVLSGGADSQKAEIDSQISALTERVSEMNASLDVRQKESVEAFKASYDEMLAETGARIKANTDEADQKIHEMRALMQEIRTQAESSRDLLMTKIETHATRLQDNLDNIEKRQKDFIGQTKIFDRADELKKNLESSITEMKTELKHIEEFNQSIEKISRDQERIKRQEEETSQKLSRFVGEKKRIDDLEGKFNQIMALSASMDTRLAEFTSNSDMLQQFQIQLKRCQDTMTDVQLKYDRFDNKSKVLDQTIEDIDKAFEQLSELEKKNGTLRSTMQTLPDEVSEFRRDIDKLLADKEKAESAAARLDTLDSVMTDIEARMDKLQKAREWIAGTETRLTTISKQAKDEVKLMGDLLKNDVSAKKGTGAPPIAQRENVKKLAALGWSPEKIAAAMEISLGEVELILEMLSDV